MKKSIGSIFLVLVFVTVSLSCSVVTAPIQPTPTLIPPTLTPIPPTFTPEPTATLLPTPTLEPTAVPTFILLPQQWNGTYTYPSTGQKQNFLFLIEKIKETTFTGKMIWQAFSNSRGATLKMNGEYITDFGNELEQIRWNNLQDYKDGDKSGTWLKWTETAVIAGGNYTTNGWYYAHIREDGTMVAVYFFNNTETIADTGIFVLKQTMR
jgi:hypothetical protein